MTYYRSTPTASLMDVFRAYPEFAKPLHEFAQQLMRGSSPFTEQERELIAAYVSGLNGCDFCRASHTEVARHYGAPGSLPEQLLGNLDTAPVAARLKPVFRYVRALTLTPARVTEADVAALYEAGWDETAVTHAALVCAFFSFMNRWVEGLGIPAEPAVVKMAGEMLHRKGYAAVIEMLGQVSSQAASRSSRTSQTS